MFMLVFLQQIYFQCFFLVFHGDYLPTGIRFNVPIKFIRSNITTAMRFKLIIKTFRQIAQLMGCLIVQVDACIYQLHITLSSNLAMHPAISECNQFSGKLCCRQYKCIENA